MAWLILVAAGVLETGLAIGLKYSDGLSRLLPSALAVASMLGSLWLASIAMRTLPVGTAYPVWVAVGAAGAAIFGVILFDEPLSPARLGFLAMLLVAIVGLHATQSA